MTVKKALITGMTAQQCSSKTVSRTGSFSSSLAKALNLSGYEVTLLPPSMDWTTTDLHSFSRVFVGVAPVTSVSANFTYGALDVLNKLWNSKKLVIFFDSPEPWKIFASLKTVDKNESSLFKSFYSRRPLYQRIHVDTESKTSVISAVEKMISSEWRTTIYPTLPWCTLPIAGVPSLAHDSFVPINFDSLDVDAVMPYNSNRSNHWIVENETSKWTKGAVSSLKLHTCTLRDLKTRSVDAATEAMSNSIGVIIGPHSDKNTWWSPRYSQALNAHTPIVTDWKKSSVLGQSWSHLAATIEDMSMIDRYELSITQKSSYLDAIPDTPEIASQVNMIMRDK